MRRQTVLVVAAAALALTGCSGPDAEPENVANTTSATTTPTNTVEVEEDTATVSQYASLVAEHRGEWDKQVADTEANCLDPDMLPACGLGYMTLGLKAETLQLVLAGARQEGNPNHLGDPPAEVEDLLADTERAAANAAVAIDNYLATECTDPMAAECASEAMTMDMAVAELSRKFAAWSAY